MPQTAILASLLFVGVALVLVLFWLVPLSLLLHRLQRRYPGYYKRIGKPYTWFTATDISLAHGGLRGNRGKAWRKFAWRLQKGWPAAFPKDRLSRMLARGYRGAVRFWAAYIVVCLLLIIPFDVVTWFSNSRPTKYGDNIKGQGSSISHGGPTESKTSSAGGTPAVKPKPPAYTPPAIQVENSDLDLADSGDDNANSHTPVVPKLSRADLTSAFGSVAPAGQKRSTKQAVCEQLLAQQQPASDLGPSPDQICTDANLQSYTTY
jgi:hypothetical protein